MQQFSNTGTLRVGVIGLGYGGEMALKGYSLLPNVEIVALAGLEEERLQTLGATYKVPNLYHYDHELLSHDSLDAVSICVPNYLHAPIAIKALKRGLHVLSEKPLARNSKEAEAMVDAATEADRVLHVVFNHRVRGDVQVLKRYIDEGKLGKIYYAKAYWMRRRGIPGAGTWFVSKEKAGGGPLIDLGVHALDMALYLLGEPEVLTVSASTYDELAKSGKGIDPNARKSGAGNVYEVEDLATAFIRLAGDATLLLEASWATNSSAGDDFGITLYGSEGGADIKVKNYSWQDTLDIYTNVAGEPATVHPQLYKGDGHITVVREFVDIIRAGNWLQHNGTEGLNRVRVIDACYASASEGHEVSLYGTSHIDDEDEPEGDE